MSKLSATDGTVKLLKKFKIPITRENWLLLATAGEVPDDLSEIADELADIGVSYIVPEAKRLQ